MKDDTCMCSTVLYCTLSFLPLNPFLSPFSFRQYSLCCLDGRIVSAGAGNKISVWRSGRERSEDWALHKWFDTEEAGIWSLVVCKGRLISGGVDGTVRVWI